MVRSHRSRAARGDRPTRAGPPGRAPAGRARPPPAPAAPRRAGAGRLAADAKSFQFQMSLRFFSSSSSFPLSLSLLSQSSPAVRCYRPTATRNPSRPPSSTASTLCPNRSPRSRRFAQRAAAGTRHREGSAQRGQRLGAPQSGDARPTAHSWATSCVHVAATSAGCVQRSIP